jgi:hypothetical protein
MSVNEISVNPNYKKIVHNLRGTGLESPEIKEF